MARDSARQAKEIELKLEFDPADAARLASHPALQAGPAPHEEQQLISTYFDTPDGALHKAGVYLRVRENGGQYRANHQDGQEQDRADRAPRMGARDYEPQSRS